MKKKNLLPDNIKTYIHSCYNTLLYSQHNFRTQNGSPLFKKQLDVSNTTLLKAPCSLLMFQTQGVLHMGKHQNSRCKPSHYRCFFLLKRKGHLFGHLQDPILYVYAQYPMLVTPVRDNVESSTSLKKGNSLQRGPGGQRPMSYFFQRLGDVDFCFRQKTLCT